MGAKGNEKKTHVQIQIQKLCAYVAVKIKSGTGWLITNIKSGIYTNTKLIQIRIHVKIQTHVKIQIQVQIQVQNLSPDVGVKI